MSLTIDPIQSDRLDVCNLPNELFLPMVDDEVDDGCPVDFSNANL